MLSALLPALDKVKRDYPSGSPCLQGFLNSELWPLQESTLWSAAVLRAGGRILEFHSSMANHSMCYQYRRTTGGPNSQGQAKEATEGSGARKRQSLQACLFVLCTFTSTQETSGPCAATLGLFFFHFYAGVFRLLVASSA